MEFLPVEHLAVLAATPVLGVAAAVVPRRRPDGPWLPVARALAVVLVVNEIMIRVVILGGTTGAGRRTSRSSSPTPP